MRDCYGQDDNQYQWEKDQGFADVGHNESSCNCFVLCVWYFVFYVLTAVRAAICGLHE